MLEKQSHTMELAATHTTGEEEWFCPTCGRRFLMHWPPEYKRVILEPGDESTAHSGAKGGLNIGLPQISVQDASDTMDERQAGQWSTWLKDIDFDNDSHK